MTEAFEGCVEKIKYRNAENGYTVFLTEYQGDDITCVGNFLQIEEGQHYLLEGQYTTSKYGEQFQVTRYEERTLKDEAMIRKYLGSGAIKGIGEALAKRIVEKFGEQAFQIIEEQPERLSEVRGISDRKAREIAVQFEEKRDMRKAMVFLSSYNISGALAVKIYERYGEKLYQILKENPYRLAKDIERVGFRTADEIAMKLGFSQDNEYRIRAIIYHTLTQAMSNGHVFLPEQKLYLEASKYANVSAEQMEHQMMQMVMEKTLILREDAERLVYIAAYYYMELSAARMLCDLDTKYDISDTVIDTRIARVEKTLSAVLDEKQREAVREAVRNGVFVLTGGPGTGKTTTINTMIRFFEEEGMDILLAAPTGRAAKRMTETTGVEARTIHRLLEFSGSPQDELHIQNNAPAFARNESNPLEADAVIIDEMSMVDIFLFHSLLRALLPGTRLILVGDVNQLPSVGPGNVLHDLIASEQFHVVTLSKIFRQAAESDIVVNAHKIYQGNMIPLDNNSKDFFFLSRRDTNVVVQSIIYLVKEKVARYVGVSPFDIQVLTPMRQGELGVEGLNDALQEALNPAAPDKRERELSNGKCFREGDKVMQIKNNYQMEWEIRSRYGIPTESGTGVFNGDCGCIKAINSFGETMTVEFDEGRLVEYPFSQLEELTLAYAITIHKSQGSEYPAIVLPLVSGPPMLFNRNVLYTAITRAQKCVMIVGAAETVERMIQNTNEQKRYTGLAKCIREIREIQ